MTFEPMPDTQLTKRIDPGSVAFDIDSVIADTILCNPGLIVLRT